MNSSTCAPAAPSREPLIPPKQPSPSEDFSSSSSSNPLRTARSLVLLQLLSRLLTFTLNQLLLRLASPAVFGTAAIQFDLVCSSILFLSREGIRNALLRSRSRTNTTYDPKKGKDGGEFKVEQENEDKQVENLSVIPLRIGIVISTLISLVYLYFSSNTTVSQPHFHVSLFLYVVAALMELSIEPLYIKIHRSINPKLNVRVQAEGGMAIIRSIITVSALIVLGEKGALLGFALGQISGSTWLVSRYLKECHWDIKSIFISKTIKGEKMYNPQTLSLAIANTGQSLIKHLLTEADRIAVARISPLDDQGGYAVAMNYGSLIARIVFQPLEESLLLHYSSSLSSSNTLPLYTLTIRLSLYLTMIIRTFVPPLYPALSPLLLPKQYQSTSAPSILRLYLTTYIPLMSLNGVSESFVSSSASPEEIKSQAKWMISSSAIFSISLYILTHLPQIYLHGEGQNFKLLNFSNEESLVLASCTAMTVRILFALLHANRTFKLRKPNLRWRDLIPNIKVFGWTWLVWGILTLLLNTDRWKVNWKGWVELVGLGGVLGLITLGLIFLAERARLKDLRRKDGKME
ncbi:uncharacterized protein IL334_004045 [Kwoniella shivajii]|uniref:Man(5)GlcNAc(2)-PP-dolichol translocation protein RFT1 n=1 Tax=Kwoniella shivajii TaxID=564305 RepID=A0ABZ1D0K7_9TREE|nr:hypothetical protein IL334_004045 [Kwoniella shivajii]